MLHTIETQLLINSEPFSTSINYICESLAESGDSGILDIDVDHCGFGTSFKLLVALNNVDQNVDGVILFASANSDCRGRIL